MTDLLSGLWAKIEGALDALKRASASLAALASEMTLDGHGPQGRKPAGRRKASDEVAEAEEAIYATAAAVSKFKCLWECIDCRGLMAGEFGERVECG